MIWFQRRISMKGAGESKCRRIIESFLFFSGAADLLFFVIYSFEDVVAQFFEQTSVLGVFEVGGEDVLKTIEGSVPGGDDGACGVIVAAVQHTPQTHLLPQVGGALVAAAVVEGAEEGVVGDDDAVRAQCSWPSVDGEVQVVLLAFLDAEYLREGGLAGGVQQHLARLSVTFNVALEVLPVPTVQVRIRIAFVGDVFLSLGQVLLEEQTEPLVGRDVLDGEGGEECGHEGTQVAEGVVVGDSARLNRHLGQLLEVVVVVESDAGRPHGRATPSAVLLKAQVVPVGAVEGQSSCSAYAGGSWRPAAHVLHAVLVVFGDAGADAVERGVRRVLEESLGGGDVHDGVVTVPEVLRVDVECFDTLLVGDPHHVPVDGNAAVVELPGALPVAHGVSH